MYKLLRNAVDTVPVVDDHSHLGWTLANDAMDYPAEEKTAIRDSFLPPAACSYGLAYQEEQHRQAYKDIYGFTDADLDDPARREATAARYEAARLDVRATMDRILQLSNVERALCTLYLPEGLEDHPQVGLVSTLDPFLFPFEGGDEPERPGSTVFARMFRHLLEGWKAEYGLPDDSFEAYLDFCNRVMDAFHARGDAGHKFLLPYVRTTYFEQVEPAEGPALWEAARGGDPRAYHRLQDLLGWHLVRRVVKNDMPLQVHTALIDAWASYADPRNFIEFLQHEDTYPLKLVLLHVGYPNFEQALTTASAARFLSTNQVHLELSGRFVFANHPAIIAKYMRTFLDFPNLWKKITYGSDALTGERYVLTAVRTIREAVYLALAGMIDDGIVDEPKAVEIARDILRNNAIRLYKLPLEIM